MAVYLNNTYPGADTGFEKGGGAKQWREMLEGGTKCARDILENS